MIDAATLALRFGLEVTRAIISWPLMSHNHRKEIVKALQSPYTRGQWKAGALSRADSKNTTESTATKRKL